jgi:myo-inositol 2-dehydrogenase / D-chiro-inositol 1-dehydrogenase
MHRGFPFQSGHWRRRPVKNSRLGVGILGAGPVTQAIHLPTLARLGDLFHVAHIMDVNASIAETVAQRVGARWSTTTDDLLADSNVDVVAVCSPPAFHSAQVVAACRAGKLAVLCEKPFALTLDDARTIAEVSAETGVPVLVGAMHTFDPGWIAATEHFGDLAATAHTITSSIVLPPNDRFEALATEIVGTVSNGEPGRSDPGVFPELISNAVMGLAIHDLPLVRHFARTGDAVEVLHAWYEPPFGYLIVVRIGDQRVELRAMMADIWEPDWTLEVLGDDMAVRLAFTPSYVHAGSAVAEIYDGASMQTFGPFDENGYVEEWRQLDTVARGTGPIQPMTSLIADLKFALDIANGAAAHLRLLEAIA